MPVPSSAPGHPVDPGYDNIAKSLLESNIFLLPSSPAIMLLHFTCKVQQRNMARLRGFTLINFRFIKPDNGCKDVLKKTSLLMS
jgi:hypothetical protein